MLLIFVNILITVFSYRDSVEGRFVPNAGFLEDVVVEDPVLSSVSRLTDTSGETSGNSLNDDRDGDTVEKGDQVGTSADDDVRVETSEEVTEDMGALKLSENVTTEEEPNDEKEQQTITSSEDVDALLDKCLLQALHTTVKDKDLPMPGSTLWILEDVVVEDPVGTSADDDVRVETSEEVTEDMGALKLSENVTTEEEPNDAKEQQTITSSEDVDALLDKCLLQALHTTVKDKDLPMPGSTLWSNNILPCRPPGTTLDIKKSSHKKLSKWLQSKSSAGLISVKEDKYKKEIMLLGVNRGHPDYMSFKPEKRVQETVNQKHDSSVGEASQAKVNLQFEVAEIYKPSTHLNPVFTSVGADTGKYYSASEASEIVFSYVEKENLVKPANKAMVVLDATLCDALFKGTIKKGSTYPTEIHKKDLGSAFLNRMQVHFRVARGNEVAVRKGTIKPVQIMTERRQGNKKVTRLSGLESFLMDAESLASELQKKFACSTSVAELPGKKGQHEVLVQGGVIDDLAKHLVDHYGVPKKYIEVLDKTKK
ncbi:Eukaryotic translation initiation factor 2D [Ananas comosus]|uniref:Eukaryotic translation initiation factor 2D n=1 Tax=Ananas comosus TaxID=4615 RepID=A0A199VE79_ANACO|nr:Eukaryotic translation initiation factor 2D [Ananas comosus]